MATKTKLKIKKKSIILLVLAIIVIVGLSLVIKYYNDLQPVNKQDKKNIEFVLKPGMASKQVAEELKNKQLIKSKSSFMFYLKTKNFKLKSGNYNLNKSMSIKDILTKLSSGKNDAVVLLKFLEGWDMDQVIKEITSKTNNTKEDVLKLLKDKDYLKELERKYDFINFDKISDKDIRYSLEGYLFPDTYHIDTKNITVKEIFKMMLDKMEKELKSLNISSSSLLPHEILTLASIVEKEGKSYEDRQKMVDLFNRRISSNISLGSDVTSYYGLGIKLNERDLTQKEYNDRNKYNTRVIKGLPIGPICMPSKSSIKAVLKPIKHDSLYFVSDKYGKIYFSKTQAEQEKVIASLKKEGKWFIHDNK
jgi:hypothetical protein